MKFNTVPTPKLKNGLTCHKLIEKSHIKESAHDMDELCLCMEVHSEYVCVSVCGLGSTISTLE